jgi:hypothetical protein
MKTEREKDDRQQQQQRGINQEAADEQSRRGSLATALSLARSPAQVTTLGRAICSRPPIGVVRPGETEGKTRKSKRAWPTDMRRRIVEGRCSPLKRLLSSHRRCCRLVRKERRKSFLFFYYCSTIIIASPPPLSSLSSTERQQYPLVQPITPPPSLRHPHLQSIHPPFTPHLFRHQLFNSTNPNDHLLLTHQK